MPCTGGCGDCILMCCGDVCGGCGVMVVMVSQSPVRQREMRRVENFTNSKQACDHENWSVCTSKKHINDAS